MAATATSKLDFVLRLVDQVSKPLKLVDASFSQLGQRGQQGIKQMGLGLAGMVGAGYALKQAMGPALAQQAALGEVQSLGVAADALDLLNQKSLAFSIAYGNNASAFVSSAYDIQSAIAGLTGTQLATFTEASNVLAKATKADAATITGYVGTMYGIFKHQADAMGKAQWVEQLTGQTAMAVQMFKTTGQGMSSAFSSLGATATSMGISMTEQLAVLGTLQTTMSGSESGTKYQAFLAGVYGAQQKLGLSFTDSQGRILPLLSILDKLKGKFGDTLDLAEMKQIEKAFGSKVALGFITGMIDQTAGLNNSIDQLGKVKGMEKAIEMAQAIADPWERFGEAVNAVRIIFGQALLPVLNPLMERLAEGGNTVLRWSKLFPNLTRIIGLSALAVMGLTAGVALMTFVFGVWRTATVPVIVLLKLWNLLNLHGALRLLGHIAMITLFVAGLSLLYTWMGIARTGMLLWQVAIWLVNAALWANPITWIIAGIIALGALIVAAVYYWDEWTTALMNSAAFQFVSEQLTALSDWFDSMGGWSGMAKAAWDGIVAIFHSAINGLIALLNKIPGVDIKTQFGELPAGPNLDSLAAAQRAQQTINAAIPSLSPNRATAVPPGGLLTSIQNSNTQNKGTHIEHLTIQNSKPMTSHELQGMLEMAG
ncbi:MULTISPECIES: phage tail tape measure protein [unclassified Pseudomonas]|uniref:phage tail tape measure protein n=1 Tax=unclassified Pseudomonas TaxID=196821 RepID=UPI000C2F8328|nr:MULTISPECIES: phage tail tape measure protein [unclassified Pseudomonas]MCU1740030.1 phage tail tape measure protein [Pseudomonas sp. 20S_6.2_Bac1]